MGIRRINSSTVLLVLFVIAAVAVVTLVHGPLDPIPRLRASATSPDGSLTVKVYQNRIVLFPPRGVRVVVKVFNKQGETVYEKNVFEDGWWHDVGLMYNKIDFEADEIRVGPKQRVEDYFVIKRAELKS